jgi:Ca-activated chloride channel homolog
VPQSAQKLSRFKNLVGRKNLMRNRNRWLGLILATQLLGGLCFLPGYAQDGSTPRPRRQTTEQGQSGSRNNTNNDKPSNNDQSSNKVTNSVDSSGEVEGQQPDETTEDSGETLKIGVELVQVVFSVVDGQERLVTNLQKDDIGLFDNGQKQTIEVFQRSNNLPMMLGILMDVSGSQEFLLPQEKDSVGTFLDSFFREGKDYGALLTFQGETTLEIGLTSNLRRLKTALQRIKREETFRDDDGGAPNLGTALFDAVDITAREVLNGKTAQRILRQDLLQTDTRQTAIRRAICILTDGVDTASELTLPKALRAAQRLGVAVFAIGVGDRFRFGDVNQEMLNKLCRETGGRAFYPKNESGLKKAFQQIAEELSSQYILAYYPSESPDNAKFRDLEITIPGQPKWQVVHRRGYLQEKQD